MPQLCKICTNPDLENLNALYLNGVSLRSIARQAGVSHTSAMRHRAHLPTLALVAVSREKLAIETRTGSALLSRIEGLVDTLERTIKDCERDKDRRNLIAAANAIRGTAELLGRLTGDLDSGGTKVQVNVGTSLLSSPEWGILCKVLIKFPEINDTLSTALKEAGL